MSETAVSIAIYAGLGLIVALVIFAGALWFANAARRGNMQFKWRRRQSAAQEERRAHPGTRGAESERKAQP